MTAPAAAALARARASAENVQKVGEWALDNAPAGGWGEGPQGDRFGWPQITSLALLLGAERAAGRAEGVAEERARCLSLCKEFSVPNVAMEIRGGAEGKAER